MEDGVKEIKNLRNGKNSISLMDYLLGIIILTCFCGGFFAWKDSLFVARMYLGPLIFCVAVVLSAVISLLAIFGNLSNKITYVCYSISAVLFGVWFIIF